MSTTLVAAPSKALSLTVADDRVKAGLPWQDAASLAQSLDLPLETLADYLSITPATFYRRKRDRRFTPAESDHVMRFTRLYALARETFENARGAAKWLKTGQPGLGGTIPLDKARTEIGARQVEDLLHQVDRGLF
jgi:putative toxin-antitoxin system antitoxin component (TIGR02293 family)